MAYIDGFVLAVPTANKQKFIDHATTIRSPNLGVRSGGEIARPTGAGRP